VAAVDTFVGHVRDGRRAEISDLFWSCQDLPAVLPDEDLVWVAEIDARHVASLTQLHRLVDRFQRPSRGPPAAARSASRSH
jgi:predicted transcriptional regulator